MTPQISVIMSAYNSSDSIERAISSILDQTFSDFELIIIDDGSTDNTVEIIRSITDERIKLFQLEHSGLPTALNYGVSQANSEIIVRHDSDDWSSSDRFAQQVKYLEDDSELDLVASWHNIVGSDGTHFGLKQSATDDADLKKMLARRSPFCHGAVAVRKSALERVGGYNVAMLYSQDYDLWLRMAAEGMKFTCIPKPLYNYSITPESIAKGWYKMANAEAIRRNALQPEHLRNYAVTGVPVISKRRTASLWNYAIGSISLDDGQRGKAAKYFLRSFAGDPFFWQALVKLGIAMVPMSLANLIIRKVKSRQESTRSI
jgi:glycosyltransferase involved in cell wall biosynthesis